MTVTVLSQSAVRERIAVMRVVDIEFFLRSPFIYQGDHITDTLGSRSHIMTKSDFLKDFH